MQVPRQSDVDSAWERTWNLWEGRLQPSYPPSHYVYRCRKTYIWILMRSAISWGCWCHAGRELAPIAEEEVPIAEGEVAAVPLAEGVPGYTITLEGARRENACCVNLCPDGGRREFTCMDPGRICLGVPLAHRETGKREQQWPGLSTVGLWCPAGELTHQLVVSGEASLTPTELITIE